MDKITAIDEILRGHAFTRKQWDAVKVIASQAYDAGAASVTPAQPEEPLALWEYELLSAPKGQGVTSDMDALNAFPDGARVEARNGLVYTKVDGEWTHDVTWRPYGTEWCDCGRFPLSDELPATVLAMTKQAPKVGDLVRVVEGAVGGVGAGSYSHEHCEGLKGYLNTDGPEEYWVPGHRGPLSDFEKVEGN